MPQAAYHIGITPNGRHWRKFIGTFVPGPVADMASAPNAIAMLRDTDSLPAQ